MKTKTTSHGQNTMAITEFQERVYTSLLAIPRGKVCSYGALAKSLSTSPRAVGGALRNNPFAPEVPCHRVIASDGHVGGFMGDWQKAPSTINQTKKLDLLAKEGVYFDDQGRLLVINKSTPSTTKHLKKSSTVTVENNAGGHDSPWFDGPWDLETAKTRLVEIMTNNDKPV
ncbi:uncharacterized protein PV06_08540 [Exophiala oligosperma]|uniref:Methylated-DNA--protein-cysteine methyltransferase n=1 Tax=Exophiala oligosperma TaxID=215243 RepID=A0A0D2AIP5_9EURO|nr:uncharacterized protein PV06_08540 [Exophiala oligosperma]KIW39981.1 hypothetical protein PV06_08540 [Exophiala oligosperma]